MVRESLTEVITAELRFPPKMTEESSRGSSSADLRGTCLRYMKGRMGLAWLEQNETAVRAGR